MSFSHFSRDAARRGQALALASLGALCATMLLAGCGGGSSSSSNSVHIRAVNAISNGGNSAISVNGTSVISGQGYFGSSAYQSFGSGASSVSFSLSANSGVTYPPVIQNLLFGNFYSLILVGRADIAAPADPRYPSVIVTSDTFSTLSGSQAGLRIIHAAPDAGNIDTLINGVVVAGGAAYKSVGAIVDESSGNVTIQVNQAGTNTILVAPQTVSVASGHIYTVYVVEPTVSPTPIYGLQETDDTSVVTSS